MDLLDFCGISIHAPRTGSDGFASMHSYRMSISIHAPRTGSDSLLCVSKQFAHDISIHAPRTGSDDNLQSVCVICHISIHAPRTGSDGEIMHTGFLGTFQSTLPARGATRVYASPLRRMHFNPRSPHGERLLLPDAPAVADGISIHAPRTGSDRRRDAAVAHLLSISIHAPRTGSDQPQAGLWRHTKDFNPRSPHGERRGVIIRTTTIQAFQSTLPARGATSTAVRCLHICGFQSTLPARGATRSAFMVVSLVIFQSTLPARGATFPAGTYPWGI